MQTCSSSYKCGVSNFTYDDDDGVCFFVTIYHRCCVIGHIFMEQSDEIRKTRRMSAFPFTEHIKQWHQIQDKKEQIKYKSQSCKCDLTLTIFLFVLFPKYFFVCLHTRNNKNASDETKVDQNNTNKTHQKQNDTNMASDT